MTKIAAIDIGSNASRLLIKEAGKQDFYIPVVNPHTDVFTRTPIHLGNDVYTLGYISEEKIDLLTTCMKQFRTIMEVNQVTRYRACATASFRDAANGKDVAKHLYEQSGIFIEIISGTEEAALARKSYYVQPHSVSGYLLFADVGGGSTDISLCHEQDELFAESFHVGSMRMTSHTQDAEPLNQLEQCLRKMKLQYQSLNLIGSGGSINKICKMFSDSDIPDCVKVSNVQYLHDTLLPLNIEERMQKYQLKRDRATIIVEAADIFLRMAYAAGVNKIFAPRIGVRDGIITQLLQDEGLLTSHS